MSSWNSGDYALLVSLALLPRRGGIYSVLLFHEVFDVAHFKVLVSPSFRRSQHPRCRYSNSSSTTLSCRCHLSDISTISKRGPSAERDKWWRSDANLHLVSCSAKKKRSNFHHSILEYMNFSHRVSFPSSDYFL